jgi:quercetin dioxygenase-like cupin family protein
LIKNAQRLTSYPGVITNLPQAEAPCKGSKAWILQGECTQLVFFEFDPDTQVPRHSHNYAQWGMVIDGEVELTVDDKTILRESGEEYLIPPKTVHSAKFFSKTRIMDLFGEKQRYKAKSPV